MIRKALFILLLATAIPSTANASIWKTLFPSLFRDNYDPYQTLTAPFSASEDDKKIDPNDIKSIDDIIPKASEVIPVNLPHASTKDVRHWVTSAVSGSMTFDGTDLREHIKASLKHFTKSGQKQYLSFLKDNQIMDALQTGQYRMNSALELQPLFIGEREDNGRYKWLFEVPLLISYLDINAKNYENRNPQNYQTTLQIQAVRVNNTESDDHDILIELWQGKVRQKK